MMGCPSDEVLAAHLAGDLPPDRACGVGEHLDSCAGCRAVVVGALRGGVITLAAVAGATELGRGALRSRRADALAPGAMIGNRYRIVDLLGAGGMGVVYEAHDTALDRPVALKVLRPDLGGSAGALAERLVRESRLMAKAAHPAVIAVHDVGRDGDRVFLAMELVKGETLGKWLRREHRTVDEVIAMFRRAGAGLVAAHRAGLVHRDFKPENVLVELDGDHVARVLVTDFGVARAVVDAEEARSSSPAIVEVELTATGVAVGTPAYMAPEQLAGQDVDERADVFGFAVSVWEALFGVRPFAGADAAEIREAIRRGLREPPRDRPSHAARGRVPAWITRALRDALVADRDARTPTVQALLDALDVSPRRRRRRRLAALAATALVGAGVALAVVAWPSGARAADPCAPRLARLDEAWNPRRAADVRRVLAATDPEVLDATVVALDKATAGWRTAHAATCREQPPEIAACLDARLLEISAIGNELVSGSAAARAVPDRLAGFIGDPAQCPTRAPALREARVPADPALQRAVAEVRRRALLIEDVRDAGDFDEALAEMTEIEAAAARLGWEPLLAEVLYVRGSIESVGTDTVKSTETLRRAALTAQRARCDQIAANVWIMLAHTSAIDLKQTDRAFEYLDLAQTAVDRLGNPPDTQSHLTYTRGIVEVNTGRLDAGEANLRRSLEIAETAAPEMRMLTVQGLAYALEDRGRFEQAAEQYRRALELLVEEAGEGHPTEVVLRSRLAFNLSQAGVVDEGVAQAQRALAVAEATLDEKHVDRLHAHNGLATVLRMAGRYAEGLAETDRALVLAEKVVGKRAQIYAEVLEMRALILHELGRSREAAKHYDRACEIIAYATGDDSLEYAGCEIDAALALTASGRGKDALGHLDHAMPIVIAANGADHIEVAGAHLTRGDVLLQLGRRADAAAAFEAARERFAGGDADDGYEAASVWGLAQAIERTEPARAESLVAAALERWKTSAPMWKQERAEAQAWLARHRRR